MSDRSPLSLDHFARHLGASFPLEVAGEGAGEEMGEERPDQALEAVLVEASPLEGGGPDAPREGFSLLFHVAGTEHLPQRTYALSHPDGGRLQLRRGAPRRLAPHPGRTLRWPVQPRCPPGTPAARAGRSRPVPNVPPVMRGAAVALTALLLAGPGQAHAQAHPSALGPRTIRHIQTISPSSGPPGTTVSVSTLNLPYEARVYVGIGAMRDGFEVLTEAEQGRLGEIAVRAQVPASTSWERPIVFIAFNAAFAPIGMSDPFHVTNEEGLVRRTGRVESDADGCLTLLDQDDNRYELFGEDAGLEPEMAVQVDGVYLEAGPCTGGPALAVSRISG